MPKARTKTAPTGPFILGSHIEVALSLPGGDLGAIDLAPDGTTLVYIGDRTIRARDAATGEECWSVTSMSGAPTALRFSPDGSRVAVSSLHGHIAVLDSASGAVLGEHRVDSSPRGGLSWSPDSARVLSASGQHKAAAALVDRDGACLSEIALPQRTATASFVDASRVLMCAAQTHVSIYDLDAQHLVTLPRPSFEIAVAASREHLALAFDHGLLLRPHGSGRLADASTLRSANRGSFKERLARNTLRLDKARAAAAKRALAWELKQAKKAWKLDAPPEGWRLWMPLPHGQIHNMRFVPGESARLLLCDWRDASIITVGDDVSERLLLGLSPIPGEPALILDVACRGARAVVSILSSNPRVESQILVLSIAEER